VRRGIHDSGQHHARGDGLEEEGRDEVAGLLVTGNDAELVTQARRGEFGARKWRVTRAPPADEGTGGDEEGHGQPHEAVAGGARDEVDDERGRAAGEQDRQAEDDDPPGHEAGALGIGRRHLGGHRDEGHLEEAVGRGASDERDQNPRDGEGLRGLGAGEERDEGEREGEAAPEDEGATAALGRGGAVADPAGDRVEDEVPRLGDEDDQTGQARGDAEAVGEVGQEQQPGDGGEGARGESAHGIAAADAGGELVGGRVRHGRTLLG
jgi:hypothetical protein